MTAIAPAVTYGCPICFFNENHRAEVRLHLRRYHAGFEEMSNVELNELIEAQ